MRLRSYFFLTEKPPSNHLKKRKTWQKSVILGGKYAKSRFLNPK